MSRFVVEPCVVIKWFVQEIDSGSAARLLDGGHELLGADTLVQGVGGLLTLKASLGELTPEPLDLYAEPFALLETAAADTA